MRARATVAGLLGFADAMEARDVADAAAAPGPELHLLTFTLDREEFGIPVTQVREVIRVSEITRVPQAPAHVRGVANLRGRILAVVELRSRLGLPAGRAHAARRAWSWSRSAGACSACWWMRVSQVTKVPEASVAPAPDEVVSTDATTSPAWPAGNPG